MCKRTALSAASASNGKSRNDDDNNSKEDYPPSTPPATATTTTTTTTATPPPPSRDAPLSQEAKGEKGTGGTGGSGSSRRRRRIPVPARRSKRDREWTPVLRHERPSSTSNARASHHHRSSGAVAGGGGKSRGGGVEALLPSAVAVVVMGFAAMARMGFRGRIEVAGIDLGTTNSVICVQALSSSVGEIDCIEDPANGSPLVPSVVSFLHRDEVSSHRRGGGGDNTNAATATSSPSVHGDVLVGHRAKLRIDMHPHSTFYHAKRFLGRPYDSDAVSDLRGEVEFDVVGADSLTSKPESSLTLTDEMMPLVQNNEDGVFFHVLGGYSPADSSSAKGRKESSSTSSSLRYHIPPEGIGSYVVRHLLYLASLHLGYDNIRSAVIAVPAKFDSVQRQATAIAFKNAGIRVARMLEEPTAAALAYGLHRKPNVNHILVYDFGGGTLDVSILHVSDGFVEVMASEGDDTLGGADFDSAVAKFLMVGGDADGRGVGAATGQVRRVAKALDALAAAAADNERQDGASGGDDGGGGGGGTVDLLGAVEERLAETCDVLEVTPLCHVSSFHTVAEKMKISLSSNDDTEYVEEECLGLPEQQDNGGKSWTFESFCSSLKPVKLSLTQNEFDQSVSHLYNRSLLPIRNVLKELDLEAEDIDEVVMVGGSTRLPMIRKLVKEELRVKALNTHIDPDITVAYGAASVID